MADFIPDAMQPGINNLRRQSLDALALLAAGITVPSAVICTYTVLPLLVAFTSLSSLENSSCRNPSIDSMQTIFSSVLLVCPRCRHTQNSAPELGYRPFIFPWK